MQSEQIFLSFSALVFFFFSQIRVSPTFFEYFVQEDSWKDKTIVGHELIFQLGLIHGLKSDERHA